MGGHNVTQKEQRVTQKLIFQLLSLYDDLPRVRILIYLFNILSEEKNDRGLSILTSHYFKPLCEKNAVPYLREAREEVFDILLNCLKDNSPYILEMTDRIQAGINLYIYMTLTERRKIKEGVIQEAIVTDYAWRDKVMKPILEGIARTV